MKPPRQKFATASIELFNERQRSIAQAKLANCPIDEDRPLEFVLREKPKVRGIDQNGLYWLRLGEIAEQVWFEGKQFSKDVWHEYAGRNLMPETVITKDGEERSKWIETPDGHVTVISTTRLERSFFAKYTTILEAFGAEHGVMFLANPREFA